MKKKGILILLIGLIMGFGVVGCSDDNNNDDNNPPVNNPGGNDNPGGTENPGGGETEVKTFTVTFNSNGGTTVLEQKITEGDKVVKPIDPTKEGYAFVGWYDGLTEFDFDTVITNDLKLTAKWDEVKNNEELAEFIAAALVKLDTYVTELISKIPYNTLKIDLQSFYDEEKEKLESVDTVEKITPCVNEIKDDLADFALTETKKLAVKEIEKFVDEELIKLPNQEIKNDLTDFSEQKIEEINDITELEEVLSTLATILEETKEHVKGLLASTVKTYLARLTEIENATAYDYLPSAMSPRYKNNLVEETDIDYDFSTFTKVSDIHKAGFGEQWQMVVENINQSVTFAKVFNVAQTALNAAGNAVDIYITNSYADDMDYSFSGEGYNGVFEFKNSKLVFNINITKTVNIPGIGSVKPVIKMEYDLFEEVKEMFISLGDAYKVKYLISDNAYEMATTYGINIAGKNASRSAYLSIVKNENKTTGHIYEYTTLDGSDKIKACADFYVENGYVSVVGNKASGILAFDGYVNELYLANEGRLIGYEVREEKTIAGITGGYNTLWFNLSDISGITTIKVADKTNANESKLSTYDVYVNGSSKLFVPTYNTKFTLKTSRKYDIELRSRFYYTYDAENDTYVAVEVKVPMMFIQEDNEQDSNFTDFSSDIKNDNNINASVKLSASHLNKILADYDTLIDIFIVNKENMSSEDIIEYLK